MKLDKSMRNREVRVRACGCPTYMHAYTHTFIHNHLHTYIQKLEDDNRNMREELQRQSGEQTEIFAYLNKELRYACVNERRQRQRQKKKKRGRGEREIILQNIWRASVCSILCPFLAGIVLFFLTSDILSVHESFFFSSFSFSPSPSLLLLLSRARAHTHTHIPASALRAR